MNRCAAGKQKRDEVPADESGSSGYEISHGCASLGKMVHDNRSWRAALYKSDCRDSSGMHDLSKRFLPVGPRIHWFARLCHEFGALTSADR